MEKWWGSLIVEQVLLVDFLLISTYVYICWMALLRGVLPFLHFLIE